MESTERDPLLPQCPASLRDSESEEPHNSRVHPYSIVVVEFLAKLCVFIAFTTSVEVLLELVCRIYWNSAPLSTLPADKCAHPSVRRYFTILNSLHGVIEGLAGLCMFGPMSRQSGRYGRRSMLIILTLFLILATLCLLGAYQLPTPFTAPLLFLWLILVSMCGTWHFDLMTAMYVVDTTSSAERSAKISVVLGWGYAAGTPGFAIGGALTTYLKSNTAIYWVVLGLALVLLTYIVFILPESFDLPRRMKLREQWQNEERDVGSDYLRSSLNAFLRPLALLKPHRNPTTGTWNLRLFWCAIHAFFSSIAAGYMWTAVIVYLALHLDFKPNDNGYVLTTASIATGTSLIVLTPAIVKLGRRLYTTNDSSSEPTRNFKVDKHMAIFGWIADIIAVASLSAAQTYAHVLICVIILGASYFRLSAFRSVVVASGDALRSGEILAAIQTITSVGNTLSGVVLGSVLTATINTHPGMVFVVYSAFASVSVIALCLIQDLDRSIVDSY